MAADFVAADLGGEVSREVRLVSSPWVGGRTFEAQEGDCFHDAHRLCTISLGFGNGRCALHELPVR